MKKPAEDSIGTIDNSVASDIRDDQDSPDVRCREFIRRAASYAVAGRVSGWVPALRVGPSPNVQGMRAERE
jgi:hypothetical protein